MRVPFTQMYTYFAGFEVLAGKSVNLCKQVNMYAHKTAGQDGWGNEISKAHMLRPRRRGQERHPSVPVELIFALIRALGQNLISPQGI